jgi:hypothetical protein
MPKQAQVKVQDISTDERGIPTAQNGEERIITYTSFKYCNADPENLKYKLLHEVDEHGMEIPGNPNLR